ncbi:MAG: hypothetical protein EAZ20_02345 [Bacteroidetes bacterium]|nr:MAG: hypothetical protein EAZ20_02345 [Bacteroidota bacterium]
MKTTIKYLFLLVFAVLFCQNKTFGNNDYAVCVINNRVEVEKKSNNFSCQTIQNNVLHTSHSLLRETNKVEIEKIETFNFTLSSTFLFEKNRKSMLKKGNIYKKCCFHPNYLHLYLYLQKLLL